MPNIKDVAREAGVSIATVSYVLNNKSTFYSEKTRLQVLEAVERVGYTPNITARNLKANQTRLLGYATHHLPRGQVNTVLDQFTYFLAQEAEAAGYHILMFTYPLDNPLPVYDDLIRTGRVDGFVIASTVSNDSRIRFLIDQQFPFVCFGRSNPEWDFGWVDTDGAGGVSTAVNHLLSLGHSRIAIAGWPEESISGSFRMQGYLDALTQAGIPIYSPYIVRGENSEQAGRDAVSYWLNLPIDEQPTAVVAIDDLVAIGVMNEASERGLAVGESFAVVGFDDMPMGQYLRPSLSTLRQPIEDICYTLITMLEDTINNRKPHHRHVLLTPELIVRGSSNFWL
jgi:DNA-binding LacI/PurR family transcriptional regulator